MGRRDHFLTTFTFWIILTRIEHTSGEAKPEPHPDPASPLTGPGPQANLPNPRIIIGPIDTYFARHEPGTLNCNAQGDPPPKITWYQNGEQIVFNSDDKPTHHRMMLSNGQLFFLRTIHTKTNQPDVGVYYCKATNIHGTVSSKHATIKIAVIRDDFRQEPVATTKSFHSTAILNCRAPRGEPEPVVSWQLNGKAIKPNDHVKIHDDGDLVISSVTTKDAGEYVCVASNKAGERQSSPAQLTVLEVPQIVEFPKDVTADEGEMVEFHCDVSGDNNVKVEWSKQGSDVSQERWLKLKDGTLRIENIEASDEGTYVCNAANDAGSVQAVAHLKVEYTPTFLIRPRSQAVAAGRTVTLQCLVVGNPRPTIFWKTKSQVSLLFAKPKQTGRFSVLEDGTLRIERVRKADEGKHTCQAINSKGEAQVSATITVRENDFRPPPVIRFGPQNQTLPQDGVALLRCQATGSPLPTIRWSKEGKPLQMTDARYTLLDSGTLQISSLKIADRGKYTCMAVSETGETTVEAFLTVESHAGSPTDPVRAPPDLTMFPGAPEKPVVSDVTDTTVRLTWQLLRDTGTSPVSSYQVEFFAYGFAETWEVGNEYTNTDVIIAGLIPNTTYVFLVRAKNNHGIGGPSPLSDLIRTLEKGQGHFITPIINLPATQIDARLPNVEVRLVRGEAVNSSAIRISWQVTNEREVVDGFMIQYKHILNMGDRQNLRYGKVQRKAIPYRPLSHTISGLESYEYYEICVMATSGNKVSPCSPPMKIQSGESVPSSPPENVIIHRESDTEILVTWSPPSIEDRKGEIIAYQIKCFSEDGTYNCSRSTNGSTHSARIDNLAAGVNYNIEMAAQTEKGIGKWSVAHSVGPDQVDITKEPWFIGMIVAIGSMLWLALCFFTIWLCRSRKQRKKLKEQWNDYTGATRPSQKSLERNGSNARKGYGVKDGSNDSGLPAEFSTLLQQSRQEDDEQTDNMYNTGRDGNHPEMKTFFQTAGPVTPYATTTLLQAQNARKQGSDQMFRPINQSYHQHSGGSGDSNTDRSNTTEVSIEMRDSSNHGNSTGDSGHLTDENGMLIKQYRKGCRPGPPQNQAVVNWSEVLPPPPIHPPNDGEYMQDEQLYSEIPEDRAKSPLSPMSVSQLSACSCPVSHSQQVPGSYNVTNVYSDNCNRCQSLRNIDNRPYSPQQLMQLQRQLGYPPNISRTLGAHHPHPNSVQHSGGPPVYLQGYQQPWDCQPLPRGPYEYDYAQVPREDGYTYTQPFQDGLVEHSNTLRGRDKKKNIQPHHGPHKGDCHDSSMPQRGPYREISNIPGGPPGNYCEGPYRDQVEALNNLNYYNRNRFEAPQIGHFEGYKIESPPSSVSASEYKVLGGGSQKSGSGGDSGGSQKNTSLKGRSSSEGNNLKEMQYQPEVEPHCRAPLYHRSRSETSPPHHCMIDEGYSRNADSPISEDPDYAEDSETGGERYNERDSMVANWESMEDCSSVHSSSSNGPDDDGQFLNEEDFASAVAKAAVMSGLTVVGSTVSADPSPKPVKKSKRHHHRQMRAPSPGYSTDSNYGTADMVHKPYPKSQRRKQLAEQGKHRNKGDNTNSNTTDTSVADTTTKNEEGDKINTKPNIPASPTHPTSPKYPSLYKNKSNPDGTTSEAQGQAGNSGNKMAMFQFGEDIPVV